MASAADRYWRQFLAAHPPATGEARPYVEAFSFGFGGDGGEAAEEIAGLVIAGRKTATGSLLWTYEHDAKPVPAAGDCWIVLGLAGAPRCVIETRQVEVFPYAEVPEIYAELGGEGDLSVAHWRSLYRRYIDSECARIGREPGDTVPLVMERFEVVYAERPAERGDGSESG